MAAWRRIVRGFRPDYGYGDWPCWNPTGSVNSSVGDRAAGRAQGREYFREM